MNYLSHFVYNHDVCGLAVEPYFAVGVVLPDLWLRFSRRKRIRWRAVRAAAPRDDTAAQLRAGLLNHVAVDRRFHVAPSFLRWQRELKSAADAPDVHPALIDFVGHMGIELALDQRLLHERPELVERFYGVVSQCDPSVVAARVGELGDVDTRGLDRILAQFFANRFLQRYTELAGLVEVVQIVLGLAEIMPPREAFLARHLSRAVTLVEPAAVWAEL